MGLFNMFNRNKENNNHNELDNTAKRFSHTAVDYAKDFNKVLDYSAKSIDALEELLDYYSKDIPLSQPTENQIWSMAMIFGSYLGEAILKNGLSQKGYHWQKEEACNIPLLVCENGWHVTPVDKVYKRLVNGREDSVVSFYRFATKEL